MQNPRLSAARVLLKIELDGGYSSLSLASELKKDASTDALGKSFTTGLVYGVLERKITLDYNIALYLTKPLKSLHPAALTLLRLGAYQLFFTDKIPPSAAVNETVALASPLKIQYARGLINAVLRKMSGSGIKYPDENSPEYYAVKTSCPKELADFFIGNYGREKADAILSASLGRRPVFIRVNTLKTTAGQLKAQMESAGVSLCATPLENCLCVSKTGDLTALDGYKNGLFFVEDMSSQLCAKLTGAKPGQTVVDCCAAPGGKSFSMALNMNGEGSIISCDMYEHKTRLIAEGAARLGIGCIKTVCRKAETLYETIGNADVVLCDVPCSGFGVIGRKPEIKEKPLSSITGLPEIQYSILASCSAMVKPGGTLVYSTCTITPAENENNALRFLSEHPDFAIAEDEEYLSYSQNGFVTVIPSPDGGDGFFVAKFTRKTN